MAAAHLMDSGSDGASNTVPTLTSTTLLVKGPAVANQHTISALAGLQGRSELVPVAEVLLLWEGRKKIVVAESGCWLWQGAKDKHGYGHLAIRRRVQLVHRVVYDLCVGKVPDGLCVLHNCPGGDNPSCCNPAHLFLGTHTDNMRDAANKGQLNPRDSRGEKNPFAVLTEEKVKAIRTRFAGLAGAKDRAGIVAAEANVNRATVYRIVRGATWKHVQ